MSVDSEAYELSMRVAPELTEAEREYVLMVARHESYYGRAQKPPVWVGTFNWGAIQGTGPAGSFTTTDAHEDGSAYAGKFKRYNSHEEGFADLVRVLLKANVREALKEGDATAAVTFQRANRYFEAPLEKYRAALIRNYAAWAAAMGREGVLSFPPLAGLTSLASRASSPSSSLSTSLPTLQVGSRGNAVLALTILLGMPRSVAFYDDGVADRVRAFQARSRLVVDGVVGPKTWERVLSANEVTKS
jgi:Putative peptidoglycan binding domain